MEGFIDWSSWMLVKSLAWEMHTLHFSKYFVKLLRNVQVSFYKLLKKRQSFIKIFEFFSQKTSFPVKMFKILKGIELFEN